MMPRRDIPKMTVGAASFYPLGSDTCFTASSDQFILLQEYVEPCHVFLFVWRDLSRVFVGGPGVDDRCRAREADTLEIEALAERFNRPELRQVLALRNAARSSGEPGD
jgi:hypothetical protein